MPTAEEMLSLVDESKRIRGSSMQEHLSRRALELAVEMHRRTIVSSTAVMDTARTFYQFMRDPDLATLPKTGGGDAAQG